jgi:hypothetical protein
MLMNASDIAKDLDREGKFPGHVCYGTSPLLVRAANMLRQQQEKLIKYELRHAEQRKRIADLEAENKFFKDLISDVEILRKAS